MAEAGAAPQVEAPHSTLQQRRIVPPPPRPVFPAQASKQLDTLRWENAIIILDEAHNVQVRQARFTRLMVGGAFLCAPTRKCAGLPARTGTSTCPPAAAPQEVCKGAASFDLTAQQRAAAIADLDKALQLVEARGGGGGMDGVYGLDGGAGDLKERLEMGRGVLMGEAHVAKGEGATVAPPFRAAGGAAASG